MSVGGESEPRAGYYVSTQDRPAFVSDLSSDDFDAVFSLMREEHDDHSHPLNGDGHNLGALGSPPADGSPQ
jgi:hypothetical protein